MKLIFRKIHSDLYCGISFFSRLPIQWLYRSDFPFSFARAIWTWPLVGLIIGAIVSLFFYGLCHLLTAPWVIAFLTLGFQLLLTGGLHEDGLADMADGFGGGKNKDHILTIMRDSRLGTYAVLTLFIILGVQVSCFSYLVQYNQHAIAAIISAAILSRVSMLLPLYYDKPARSDGLASILNHIPFCSSIIAILITFSFIWAMNPWILSFTYILTAFVISFIITIISHRYIQGYTGDTLGAIQVIVTTGILIITTFFRIV